MIARADKFLSAGDPAALTTLSGQAILPKRSLAIMLSALLREIGYVHVKIYRSAKPAQSNLRAGRCRRQDQPKHRLIPHALVVVNIISITLESVPQIYADHKKLFIWIEIISVGIFTVE